MRAGLWLVAWIAVFDLVRGTFDLLNYFYPETDLVPDLIRAIAPELAAERLNRYLHSGVTNLAVGICFAIYAITMAKRDRRNPPKPWPLPYPRTVAAIYLGGSSVILAAVIFIIVPSLRNGERSSWSQIELIVCTGLVVVGALYASYAGVKALRGQP